MIQLNVYSKTCVKLLLSKRPKMVFKTNYRIMHVKSIAECSKGNILQYYRPSLNYQLSLRYLFCLFLRGRFTQALLNAGQKYCGMLRGEHSVILSTFIQLPYVIKIFVLSIFERLFYTGFTVCDTVNPLYNDSVCPQLM